MAGRRNAASCCKPPSEALDRLSRLVDNLLDLSRLQAGVAARCSCAPPHSTRWCRRRSTELGRGQRRGCSWTSPHTLPWSTSTQPCWSASSPTWSATRSGTLRRAAAAADGQRLRRPGATAGRRPRARHPPRPTGPGSSFPSSDSATPTNHRRRIGPRARPGLTEAMGGTLEPEDTPGGGLTMVRLADRRARARTPRSRCPGRRERDRRGGQPVTEVLVVDDEPSLVRALQINLKARHYHVHTAVDRRDALLAAAAIPRPGDPRPRACPTWTACR